jgi:hypothetical protein
MTFLSAGINLCFFAVAKLGHSPSKHPNLGDFHPQLAVWHIFGIKQGDQYLLK